MKAVPHAGFLIRSGKKKDEGQIPLLMESDLVLLALNFFGVFIDFGFDKVGGGGHRAKSGIHAAVGGEEPLVFRPVDAGEDARHVENMVRQFRDNQVVLIVPGGGNNHLHIGD